MSLSSTLLPQSCDIFRAGSGSPASVNVPCQLVPAFAQGRERYAGEANAYTHYLVVDAAVDIRDGSTGIAANNPANADTVQIPGDNEIPAVAYKVVYVEYVNRGAPGEYKRVYLNRQGPPWQVI